MILTASTASVASMTSTASFHKEIPNFMFPSTLVSQCGMDHQKPTMLLIFGTLSLGGCVGHPMRPKLNLKDKVQISKPNEYTDNFKSNLTCIFLSVRAKLNKHFALEHCPSRSVDRPFENK